MTDNSLNNWSLMTDHKLSELIGGFVKHHRLAKNMSQEQLSKVAGISRSTLSLLERGQTVTLTTFLQVLRVLDLLHIMEVFDVKEEISPLAYAKLKKKQKQRARTNNNDQPKEDLGW